MMLHRAPGFRVLRALYGHVRRGFYPTGLALAGVLFPPFSSRPGRACSHAGDSIAHDSSGFCTPRYAHGHRHAGRQHRGFRPLLAHQASCAQAVKTPYRSVFYHQARALSSIARWVEKLFYDAERINDSYCVPKNRPSVHQFFQNCYQ